MIEQFSPLTRRVVAAGLAILLFLLLIQSVAMPVNGLVRTSLADLGASRARLQRLEAISARPDQPHSEPAPAGLAIEARDATSAGAALVNTIGAARQRAGLQALDVSPAPGDPRLPDHVAAQVHCVGPMEAILTLANELERARPLVRFSAWKIEPVQGQASQLQLTGTVEAVWTASQ
jgi:hypothetical protein